MIIKSHFKNHFESSVYKRISYFHFFGPIKGVIFVILRMIKRGYGWQHRQTLNWIRKHYAYVITRHKDNTYQCDSIVADCPIYVLWYQGEWQAPPIVKACIASIRRNAGQHPVHVLDRENLSDYLTLPQHITDKVKAGKITLTHLSDIIRMRLLSDRGGIWIDSTYYITRPIGSWSTRIYTIKHTRYNNTPWNDKFIENFFATNKNDPVARFVYDFLIEYWRDHNRLINYFLIDYAMTIAYENMECFRNEIARLPYIAKPKPSQDIMRYINTPYSDELWQRLTRQQFNKLTYKKHLVKGDTIGQHILNNQ